MREGLSSRVNLVLEAHRPVAAFLQKVVDPPAGMKPDLPALDHGTEWLSAHFFRAIGTGFIQDHSMTS